MYEFTLLKSMFFELDKYKIEGVTQTKEKQRTFRRLEVSYDSVPEITSITAEERILPYVDRYYLFINDERVDTDIHDPKVKQVIYEFYKQHHPEYLKVCPSYSKSERHQAQNLSESSTGSFATV